MSDDQVVSDGLVVSVGCPLCSVPIELPSEQARVVPVEGSAVRLRLTLRTEPLFEHVTEQHGAPVLATLRRGRHVADDVAGPTLTWDELVHDTSGLVEQRELPESRTSTDIE